MTTLIISKEEAEQIVNEDHENWQLISETIEGQSRWSTHYSGIFKHIPTNKHYEVSYSRGSTEQQDQDLFYEDNIDFFEVEEKEVIVKKWVRI